MSPPMSPRWLAALLALAALTVSVQTATVAYEFKGALPDAARFQSEGASAMPPKTMPRKEVEVQIRKPSGHSGH